MKPWQDDALSGLAGSIRKIAQTLSEPEVVQPVSGTGLSKLASVYTDLVYLGLVAQVKEAKSRDMPEDIEHPFRHYWGKRLGGAAVGAALGGLAGGGGMKSVVGGMAGAFAGEKIGETQAILDHYKTVQTLDEAGVQLPSSVRHPHYYGLSAHEAGIQAMNLPKQTPFNVPSGGY